MTEAVSKAPPAFARRPGFRWVVFGLLAGAYLLVYFHRLCPAAVAVDLMADLSVDGTFMGLLASAYFYPYSFMQIPAGLLADSWGPRKTVSTFFLLAAAGAAIFAVAERPGVALFARTLVGVGVAMVFVPTTKVLTRWFRPSDFAVMTGVLMAVGGLGAVIATTPLAWLSGVIGWRGSFGVTAVVTFVLAVAIRIFVRDRPEGATPSREGEHEGGAAPATAIPVRRAVGMVFRERRLLPIIVWYFLITGVFFAFGGLWAGPFMTHVYKMNRVEAGNVMAVFSVAMIFGSPLLSFLSERVFRSRKVVIVGTSALMVVCTAFLAFATTSFTRTSLTVLCLGLAIGCLSVVAVGFVAVKELFPTEMAGTAVGLANLFPFLGVAVMQPLLGWVLDRAGPVGGPYPASAYALAFTVLFWASVGAFAAACLMSETFQRGPRD